MIHARSWSRRRGTFALIALLGAAGPAQFEASAMAQSRPATTDDPYADTPPASPGADDVYESEQAATEKARTLFSVGAGFAQLGQWDKAYPILKKAFELKKHWQIVLWLAKSEAHLGKYKDAVTHAEMVLSDPELAVPETGRGIL